MDIASIIEMLGIERGLFILGLLCVVILVIIYFGWRRRGHGDISGYSTTGNTLREESNRPVTRRAEAAGEQIPPQAPENLKTFINTKVVPSFNGQRVEEGQLQFAVVILSQYSINNIQKTQFKNSCPNKKKLVDNSVISFPENDQHLVNYIVARVDHPDQDQGLATPVHNTHAEKTLLNRFNILKDEFPESEIISTVLFYSWLMPCSDCTKYLIQKFKNSADYDVVIVYNNDWTKCIPEEENKKNRNLLREAGIDVYQVRYRLPLPPIQSS